MRQTIVLWLAIFVISVSPGSCEEVAYAFSESGMLELDQHVVSEYNGSETIALTVASSLGGEVRNMNQEELLTQLKRKSTNE